MTTSATSQAALQMKTAASGRPFLKDMHDLFSAFVSSVNISTNRSTLAPISARAPQIVKSYPNTFTADDVISTLSHLNFTQTITQTDPQDVSRIITTKVTTTFSMANEMAQQLFGHFLEAHLIFNAEDPTDKVLILRPQGIYGLTSKGNIVYETFLRKAESGVLTASSSAPLSELSSQQMNSWTTRSGTLLALPRNEDDDQLTLNHTTIETTFKAFSGPTPNYTENTPPPLAIISKDDATAAVSLCEGPGLIGIRVKDFQQTFRKIRTAFKGVSAVDWLLANTTALNRSEAKAIANQYIQYRYIQYASPNSEKEVEILDSTQGVYQLSEEGKELAGWNDMKSNNSSSSQIVEKKNAAAAKSFLATRSMSASECPPVAIKRSLSATERPPPVITRSGSASESPPVEELPSKPSAAAWESITQLIGSSRGDSMTALQMKMTASGRPYLKDVHDLFSAFVDSVNITTNRITLAPFSARAPPIVKSYPNTFTAEDVINTLSELNFSQTISHPDPNGASRVDTKTVSATFHLTKEMAQHLCGQFLEAHLIFNAADPTEKAMVLRPDGTYGLTCKGNVVYETLREPESAVRTESNSTSTELSSRQKTSPLGTLLFLPREEESDQIILNHSTIESTFKAFSGPNPNYTESNVPDPIAKISKIRVPVQVSLSPDELNKEKEPGLIGIRVKDHQQSFRKIRTAFKGSNAVDWLLANTTALNRSEPLAIANQFLLYGYIQQAPSQSEKELQVVDSIQAIYQISDEGKAVAGWNLTESNDSSVRSLATSNMGAYERTPSESSSTRSSRSILGSLMQRTSWGETDFKSHKRLEPRPSVASLTKESKETKVSPVGSTTQRLTIVLAEPELRNLFMEFLQSMFCQENLEFYNDVVAFKTEFGKTSELSKEENSKMIFQAIGIYKTYLCPGAEKELNINHTVRRDMVNYMTAVMEHVSPTTGEPTTHDDDADKGNVPNMTVNVFDKIEHHIFHLMASDSIPKFVKTSAFKEEITSHFYPGLSMPKGGPLMNISTFLEIQEGDENATKGLKNSASSTRRSLSPRASSASPIFTLDKIPSVAGNEMSPNTSDSWFKGTM